MELENVLWNPNSFQEHQILIEILFNYRLIAVEKIILILEYAKLHEMMANPYFSLLNIKLIRSLTIITIEIKITGVPPKFAQY